VVTTVEGRVFVCSWRKVGDRIQVWVRDLPKLRSEGATFAEADEALWDVICAATGDGENIHEYDPPAPVTRLPGVSSELVLAGCEGLAFITNGPDLFAGGLCPQCDHARGQRTGQPLKLHVVRADDAGRAKVKQYSGSRLKFFSEVFLSLLRPAERAQFEFRSVECDRGRKIFFELAGSRVHVPLVALRGASLDLWVCDTCGWGNQPMHAGMGSFPAWLSDAADGRWFELPAWYVSAAGLPRPLPTCLTVGRAPEYALCFTRRRWAELVGERGARGIKSHRVPVVSSEYVDPDPPRRLHSEVWGQARP